MNRDENDLKWKGGSHGKRFQTTLKREKINSSKLSFYLLLVSILRSKTERTRPQNKAFVLEEACLYIRLE